MLTRAPRLNSGWHLPSLAENEAIFQRYKNGAANDFSGVPGGFAVQPTPLVRAPLLPPAVAQRVAQAGGDPAPAQNKTQEWQAAASTQRYEARQAARGVSRRSPDYGAARDFLRIDGSAPHSPLDTMGTQGAESPAPVDFAGRPTNGGRSYGFQGSAAATSTDIATGDFKWKKPLTYGDLGKKYSFPENDGYRVTGDGIVRGINNA